MSEAERGERLAEEAQPSLDEFLNGIAMLRQSLEDEKERILSRMEADKARLAEVDSELERIEGILAQGGKLKKVATPDRSSRVEKRVMLALEIAFREGCAEVSDDHLVKVVRDEHPDLTPESILSAVRRLAKNGKIERKGRRRAMVSCPVLKKVPEPLAVSMDDRVLEALLQNKSKQMTLHQLVWACGGDAIVVDAAVKGLAEKRRIEVFIHEEEGGVRVPKYQHKEPDKVAPIGTPLFDGMEKP